MADKSFLRLEIQIPFSSESEARIACNSLTVDAEPKRGGAKKVLIVTKNVLHVTMTAAEAKVLRVAANSFMDLLILVTETIQEFGPPVE